MAGKATKNRAAARTGVEDGADPPSPRQRLPLKSAEDVRRELARLYREARGKRMDVADASRLANILQILGRLIETSDLEARVIEVERLLADQRQRNPGFGAIRH